MLENAQYVEKPMMTLRDYVRLVVAGKWWIIVSALCFLSVSAYLTSKKRPVYETATVVMIENRNQTQGVFGMGDFDDSWGMTNEIELIKSRSMAEAVVEELWNSEHRNHLYLFGTREFVTRSEKPKRWFKSVITFGGWDVGKIAVKQFNQPFSEQIAQQYSGAVKGRLTVSHLRYTDLLKIRMRSEDPNEAALLANTVANVYKQKDREFASERTLEMKDFLVDQVGKKEKELALAEDALRDYEEKELVFGLDVQASLLLTQVTQIESRFYSDLAEVSIVRQKRAYTEGQLSEHEKVLAKELLGSINARVFALRTEIAEREAELVRNASLYGEDHEAVNTTRRKIKSLKKRLNEETSLLIAQRMSVADPIEYRQGLITGLLELEGQLAGLKARTSEVGKLVELYNSRLEQLPSKQLQFARLERDRSVLEQTYGLMRARLEETRITEASEAGKVRIIDTAIPLGGPVGPNTKADLLLGLVLGTAFGFGLVLLREHLDNTVKSPEDIERYGLSVWGVVPAIGKSQNGKYGRKSSNSDSETAGNGDRESAKLMRPIIAHEDPKSPVSEAFRGIRTNIAYSKADTKIRSMLLTSPGPQEGKSTIIVNLAITFANLGLKTLLIDSDLRRPTLHRFFGVSRESGLTQYLSGSDQKFDSMVLETEFENLSFVPSGPIPPNPSELLGSERMSHLVAKLEKKWDMVLFDSPPIGAVTDAGIICKEIDSICLAVRSGETDKGALIQSLRTLNQISAPLGGVILNAVTRKAFYKSYYNYYHYYYSDKDKREPRSRLGNTVRRIRKIVRSAV
ncbi:MAG: polysaccharide biosynthesis tyrosine autokinase [Candidatus Neomarinimicrobiota bacterium]